MQHVADSPARAQARTYWKRKLDGVALSLDLPFDAVTRTGNANCAFPVHLPRESRQTSVVPSHAHGTTLSPVFFAIHLLWLLWRVSGQAVLTSGYPQAGRDVPDSETIYGMLVSMAA